MSSEHTNHFSGMTEYVLSLEGLVEYGGLSEVELLTLVAHEIVSPIDRLDLRWVFRSNCLLRVQKANRRRNDLELDIKAVALPLKLLDRIEALERELSGMDDKK